MEFKDIYINKEKRFSLGQELESGKFYISIPVSSQMVDYEEYYEVSKKIINQYPSNIDEVLVIVEACKKHKNDNALFMRPGKDRGVG